MLESEAEARAYERKVGLAQVVRVMFDAFLWRRSGLESILASGQLATRNKSTLSYCLRRPSVLKLANSMLDVLHRSFRWKHSSIVVIDSMAVTLPRTQRSNCAKFNDATIGGGVMWQFLVNAPRGVTPIHILKIVRGAWNDSFQIRSCQLVPNGPIYVMDRGFYAFSSIAQWLEQGVRFIVRGKKQQCHYQVLETLGPPRFIGAVEVIFDGIAIIGTNGKTQVQVRLVYAMKNGKDLILVSNLNKHSAEQILATYKHRWAIERFHKLVKHSIGLAHLYSFQKTGIELLLTISSLLAILLYLASNATNKTDVVKQIRAVLRSIRRALNITEWRYNICIGKRYRKRANH